MSISVLDMDEDSDDLDIWDEECEEEGDRLEPHALDEPDDLDEDELEPDDLDEDEPDDDEPDDDEPDPSDPAEPEDQRPPEDDYARPVTHADGRPARVRIREGECVHELAARLGLTVDKIWSHPDNAHLHEHRTPTQLVPGDVVAIPPQTLKKVAVRTSKTHTIRIVDPRRCRLRLRFLQRGRPRSAVPFTLVVGRHRTEGTTDEEGRIELSVPSQARGGVVILHADSGDERHPLRIGSLRPVSEITGVQARLDRLGFRCGALDGLAGPKTNRAARVYRRASESGRAGDDLGPLDATLSSGAHDA